MEKYFRNFSLNNHFFNLPFLDDRILPPLSELMATTDYEPPWEWTNKYREE